MQIFLVNPRGKKTASISLNWLFAGVSAIGLLIAAAVFWAGIEYGALTAKQGPLEDIRRLRSALQAQQKELMELQRSSQNEMNALALRLGQLQSQMLRLNAVGQRVAAKAKLDSGEFDFSELPPVGGPELETELQAQNVDDLSADMGALEKLLRQRETQLNMLELLLTNRALEQEILPAGKPVKQGWLSSNYGWRTDPFSGRRAFHHGVDFAAKRGTDVIAVASGVVSWAGTRSGYGELVEIKHGDGYVTRYGHNDKILVKVGETVQSGEAIALMGSTGHATGPHVHFEVLKDGKKISPTKYIRASR